MALSIRVTVMTAAAFLSLAGTTQAVDWRAKPNFGTIELNAGFRPDPYITSVSAGGAESANSVGDNCQGFISNAPDMDLNYKAGSSSLTIYVESAADTTLVIYDAAGNWHCNDDYSSEAGTNPAVRWTNPPSGNYNIWIGTYESGSLQDSQLHVTELAPAWSRPASSTSATDIEWGDNTSEWANDGECDDPRFAGPGTSSINNAVDRYHDASDCRTLHQQGRIYLQ
ncbi:hypothetical protein [Saccharospirillum impatiens]|uniref:hypothetical protein n=1 Tax=Saccharospirillum impatiens TaxID=169438 RepID=UPI00041D85AD|nr:hypothetical protein [Saccharospirillum impatiens]